MSSATRTSSSAAKAPLVIHASASLDGTSFAVAAESTMRLRQTFPRVRVTTRLFISHDPVEGFGGFEDQIVFMLTGLPTSALVTELGPISFRDPQAVERHPLA